MELVHFVQYQHCLVNVDKSQHVVLECKRIGNKQCNSLLRNWRRNTYGGRNACQFHYESV